VTNCTDAKSTDTGEISQLLKEETRLSCSRYGWCGIGFL